MNVVLGHDAVVAEWAGKRVGRSFREPLAGAVGFLDQTGALAAAALFHGLGEGNVELTVVGRLSIRRSAFRSISDIVFNRLGCRRMTAIIGAGNAPSIHAAEWAGFVREGVLRRFFESGDGVVFGMLKEECRWL